MASSPDLIIWGSHFRTLDPDLPHCSAVAVSNGTITATGDDDTIRAMRGPGTKVIDGRDIAFVPGLTDSHIHPLLGAIATQGADLYNAKSIAEMRRRVQAERERVGPSAWVTGWGVHYEPFAEEGILGSFFDEATAGQPMILTFFDGHTAVANAAALAAAGVTGPVEFTEESYVVCRDNIPTGELQESGAMNLVRAAMPEPDATMRYGWYRDAFRRFSEAGLTSLHAMDGVPEDLEIYRQLEANGDLSCRVVVPMWQTPDMSLAEMKERLPFRDEHGHLWRCGSAKFFIDGVIDTGTGWLVAPDTFGDGNNPFWPDPDYYAAAVALFARAGFQCITHAVGDRAVQAALDAYEAAANAPSDTVKGPHRIEHIELVQDHDIPRFADLGVTASMQPLHLEPAAVGDTDGWATRVGPERTKQAFRARSLLDAGATLALGSDWMVAPIDPRLGMAWARLRREPQQEVVPPRAPDQALTALQALEGYTTGAATAIGEGHHLGRIKPGYRADFTGFAADPVESDADALLDVPIVMTIVDGRVTHESR